MLHPRAWTCSLALGLLLANSGCSIAEVFDAARTEEDTSKSESSSSEPSTTTVEQGVTPTKSGSEAIVEGGFFRTAQGDLTLTFPALSSDWAIRRADLGDFEGVLASTTGALVHIVVSASSSAPAKLDAVHDDVRTRLQQAHPDVTGWTENGERIDGAASGQGLLSVFAARRDGAEVKGALMVVPAGSRSVAALLVASPAQGGNWQEVVLPTLQSIKVGAKVPRLPKHDPKQTLSGIYQGPSDLLDTGSVVHQWWFFDPRGYAFRGPPSGVLALDLEARYQAGAIDLLTYEVSGAELIVSPLGKPSERQSSRFEGSGDTLVIDGTTFTRADGRADGRAYTGKYVHEFYRATTFGDSLSTSQRLTTYVFEPGGRFIFTSNSDFLATIAGTTGPEGTGFAGRSGEPIRGSYRIAGDRIELTLDGGGKASEVLLPCLSEAKADFGQPSDECVYIAGKAFSKTQ
jgi:hypothetical protein